MVRFGYFGHFFHGLQPQKGLPTAGGTLQDWITECAGQAPKALCFSARTDKGVHALHNIGTFWFPNLEDIPGFLARLQQCPCNGLVNVEAIEVDPSVHARGSALGKHYRYVLNGPDAQTSWQIVPELNLTTMRLALDACLGTHDFKSFQGGGCSAGTTVKTLFHLGLTSNEQGIQIDIFGNAFLRKMIRNLVGVLVEIGTGLRKPGEMAEIIASKHRQAAGITAPACGLTLVSVELKNLGAFGT
ncbi:MAG: tRNA pseudouridine synthase A [Myxococcaceae bacterium]|nr:tRNA pseudouridine synthase A [Myxococcaceae bacterium]